jgi:hypothetical protein
MKIDPKLTNGKHKKHGMSGHPLYTVWINMLHRCYDSDNKRYSTYGAVGIHICKEWREDVTVFIKWALENGWEPGLTIDRIDGILSYYPPNCRFITKSENSKNHKPYERRDPKKWINPLYTPI